MWQNIRIRLFCVFSLLLLVVCCAMAEPQKSDTIPNGTWGGAHIRIDVADGSATIDYDCANGTIEGPLNIKSDGKFDLRGVHNKEHGGPVRSDETANSHPARYEGWTDGKTMKLKVVLPDSNEEIGTFTLVHGKVGRVFKCK